MTFYVYQYLSDDGTPYYIGKGSGRRMHVEHLFTPLPPVDCRIVIKDNLTNEEAKKLEGELITKYGRKLDGGTLDNIKINQWACAVGWKHSDAAKQKISEGNRGKTRTPEQRAKLMKPRPPEVIEKIRQANIGRPYDPVRSAKISATLKRIHAERKLKEELNG